jgi:DNA-binding MarR family transcriptional regulator
MEIRPTYRGRSSAEAGRIGATTVRRLAEAYEPLLRRLRLRRQEYLVLALLWEGDGRPAAHLAACLRVPEGMLAVWLAAMERRGLIERDAAAEPEDVWLTERGRALQARAPRVPSALLCHVLAWLDHDELEPPAAGPARRRPREETGECPDGAEA